MSRLLLRVDRWPLVVTTLRDGATDADYDAYLESFEARVLAREEHFASLVDATAATEAPSAPQRKKVAEWQKRQLDRGVRFNVGVAMVVPNRVVRGALTALHWLLPPPTPTVTLATFDEAYAWCIGRLGERGVPLGHLAGSTAAPR